MEEEKRQREHESALDNLRRMKLEKEKRDLEHLQELEKLQKEKERLDKREAEQMAAKEKLKNEMSKKNKVDDDAQSVMSDATMDTMASEEPDRAAEELNEAEKQQWAKEGKSELDKKYFGIFSRARHGRYHDCERILLTEVDGKKVPVDVRDENGNTPLIVASQNNRKRVAKLFLRNKADINAINVHGNTCLHYCFTYGYGELGDYLISKGANDALKNKNGLTCYDGLDQTRQASAVRPRSKMK
ncbi:hypothetical protein GUITHDRAFT_93862 [Guillardia theta CCMP2712]|uniref:Uncharacterized protein n=2 Tax=Guillardia theta TaxID=55529 RepID=L1JIH9_GUITC|nr:hypothetical protein GUITHDRAFT_93862 [Guillardia theta CCMP2712]EKX47900.1 hypothetical protein GUITHDRAFT_93862 [Guillardia theta CCMP2712]|eukprot:XP_005834880.1 hypothetical protein GUITHDRAFT_93862 [Guillardia theta CCMP2712]